MAPPDQTNDPNAMLTMWLQYQEEIAKAQKSFYSGGTDVSSAMQQTMDAARESWGAWEKQAADWMKTAEHWLPADLKSDTTNTLIADSLKRLLDPKYFSFAALDEVSASVQRLAEGPEFADMGLFEKQVLQSTSEWLAMREADARYRQITGEAWARAFQTFSAEIAGDWSKLGSDPRKALDRWLAIANDELIRTQRQEDFLDASRKLFRSSVEYRLKQRELTEIWCENYSIPTRTEIDDLHRTVTELRRELRALKRQQSGNTNQVAAKAGAGEQVTDKVAVTAKKAAKKEVIAKKAVAKKTVAKKAVAKKAVAKKAVAKKAAATKIVAKMAGAKNPSAKKPVTKMAVAKKTEAKKTATRKAPNRKSASTGVAGAATSAVSKRRARQS